MDNTKKGAFLMSLSALFNGVMYIISDAILRCNPGIQPISVFFWGTLVALVMVSPYYFCSQKKRHRVYKCFTTYWQLIALLAVVTALGGVLWWCAIEQTSSGIVALFGKSEPVFTFLLGWLFLSERIKGKEFIGILIAAYGFYMISSLKGEVQIYYIMLMISSSFLYSLQSFFLKKYGKHMESIYFTFIRLGFMVIFLGVIFSALGKINFVPLSICLCAGIGVFFNSVLAKMCYFEAHKCMPISKLNLFLLLKAVFVLAGSILIFGDPVSATKVFGAFLILCGMAYFYHVQNGRQNFQKGECDECKDCH